MASAAFETLKTSLTEMPSANCTLPAPLAVAAASAAPKMSPDSTAFATLATAATSLRPANPATLATAPKTSP